MHCSGPGGLTSCIVWIASDALAVMKIPWLVSFCSSDFTWLHWKGSNKSARKKIKRNSMRWKKFLTSSVFPQLLYLLEQWKFILSELEDLGLRKGSNATGRIRKETPKCSTSWAEGLCKCSCLLSEMIRAKWYEQTGPLNYAALPTENFKGKW